jgi:two-component system sensor histidine kinase KdpD
VQRPPTRRAWRPWHTARDLALAGAAIAAAAAILWRLIGTDNPTIVALTLLLVVLAAATVSRLSVAIVTAVVAMFTFNYFFLPPVGTLTIADPQNWIALVAFLAAAIIVSQLSSAAQDRARDAVESRREVARLFDLSRDILLTTESAEALPVVARHVARRFDLEAVAICLPHGGEWVLYQGGEREVTPDAQDLDRTLASLRGTLEYDARERAYGGHVEVQDGSGRPIVLVPLRLGTRPVGLLATDDASRGVGSLDALGGVVAIAIERTAFLLERKNAEALQQRADLASALLASMSHDLRTPLTAVGVAVTNLQDSRIGERERQAQARLALQELERLNRIFQDILDMARIDAAGITAERQWVTPADIVDAALAHGGSLLDERRLNVDAQSDVEVHVDPRLTSNALAHLIENAAFYSPPDTDIDVTGEARAEELYLAVRDRGLGLDAGELEHLFERFYRGAAARQMTTGSGMGLAITRGLLAAEGGRVWGESVPGGGANFTIVIPAARRRMPVEEP